MPLAEQIIAVESSVASGGETAEHIKLIVSDTPDVIIHLSLGQARSLAISLVEQVHRLEVANNMRNTKLKQTRATQIWSLNNNGSECTLDCVATIV